MSGSKSVVVRTTLQKHTEKKSPTLSAASCSKRAGTDPFLALIGSGNRKYSTDQIMRMTRGDEWNQS